MVHQHVIWHGISFPLNHPNGLREVGERTNTGSGWVFKQSLQQPQRISARTDTRLARNEIRLQHPIPASGQNWGISPHLSTPLAGHLLSKPGTPTSMGFVSFSARSLSPGAYLHLRPWLNNYLASPENSG